MVRYRLKTTALQKTILLSANNCTLACVKVVTYKQFVYKSHTHTHTHTHTYIYYIYIYIYIYIMKRSFFQAAVMSILLYGCTTWTLTKRLEKKLDSNYTRMLRAILNKSWWQHPTRHQLYSHLPPITKTVQVR